MVKEHINQDNSNHIALYPDSSNGMDIYRPWLGILLRDGLLGSLPLVHPYDLFAYHLLYYSDNCAVLKENSLHCPDGMVGH